MSRRSAAAFLSLALFAGAARADLLPDGYKPVKLSIRVDADVPAGKALILAHTFRAIDVIKPGAAAEVEWHPAGGKMVIMSVPASNLTSKVEEQRKALEREPLKEIERSGKPCHDGFDGIRTVPIAAPADHVRWNYKVTFSGDTCTATLVKMEFFDVNGKPVEGTDVPNIPSGAPMAAPPPATATSAATSPSAAPSGTAAAPPPGEAPKGACGCEVGPGAAPGATAAGLAAALGLLFAARRRRNRLYSAARARG
jgi:MYXO-CTERM domain-containing protein